MRIEFDHAPAQHDVIVQVLAAQIEKAVLEPDVLRIVLLTEHGHRQFGRRPQHLDLVDIDLDVAGRQFLVKRPLGTDAHLAVDAHHPFRAQRLGQREGRAVGVGHDLRDAVMVAQIDEQHPAMVADSMAPAGKPHGLPDVALAKRAAGVGAIAMHEEFWPILG